MNRKEIFLVALYLIGAVADAVVSIPMFGAAFSAKYDYGTSFFIANGAILMIAWTVLLLWAAFKPAARREILLITLVPIVGLFISNWVIYPQAAYSTGLFLFRVIGGALLGLLYIFGYVFTRPAKAYGALK